MQEQQHQIKIYGFLQKAVYAVVALDCASLFYMNANIPVVSNLLKNFAKMSFFYPPIYAKLSTLILIGLVAIGTKAKKKRDLNIATEIILPMVLGLLMIFGSLYFVILAENPYFPKILPTLSFYQIVYAVLSFLGAVVLQVGADSVSKLMQQKMGKDRWNVEEESFDQNQELVKSDLMINIPYLFRYKGKLNKGWMNINPFRGTMVIGTPGSGKSFGVINPAIRQMIAKGFCLCIYDFKFPDLAQIAYYHYLLKKSKESDYDYQFHVINLNEIEKSKRVNPFKKEYVRTLAEAQEMAEAMVSSLQKGGASAGGGSDQFFTQSAINFLSSCIYFFATHENGKYSDLPHILSFMNRSYKEIFDALFTNEEILSLLSPFKTAYDNKAFDQLEGQIGTLKIFLSRLATKESFWVFSGDEVELKITNRDNPSILILASDPGTQDINSALYSSVLNRTLRLINSKHNLPGGIIADEFPTIYIHKIDNIVATARSNKVAVLLGLQELPQLRQFYKKEVADTISAIVGNILSGSARDKNTLDWLEKLFGKIKQKSYSQSISQQGTTTSINEKMDFMIPAGKIAALKTGEMVGMIAQGEENDTEEYKTSAVSGKINLDMNVIKKEENNFVKMPSYYSFVDKTGINRKEEVLMTNFRKINKEVELIVNELKNRRMKNILFRITVSLFLFISCFSWAQFNTLTPIQPQKSEIQKVSVSTNENAQTAKKKDKKSWKGIFNLTSKFDLKNELDSLKTLLKNQEINQQKKDEKRKNDSLISRIKALELKQQKLQKQEDLKNSFQYEQLQFETQFEKAHFGDLGAPLQNKLIVTSPFGTRSHPIFGTVKSHNGIDLKANYENVYSVLDGIVTATGWDSKGGGNFIKINHFNRFETSYLHLSEIYYQVGEKVKAGFVIAKSGNTGNSTGPHLHFGVKEFDKVINPIHFLNDLNKAQNLITNYYEY